MKITKYILISLLTLAFFSLHFQCTNNIPNSIIYNEISIIQATPIDSTNGWEFQSSGTSEDLSSIDMINETDGWIVGDYGTILHTINGGITWSNNSILGVTDDFRSVAFYNETLGWIAGFRIWKTTDGGLNWHDRTPFLVNHFENLNIIDENTIILSKSYSQTLYRSNNGGSSWTSYVLSFNINDISFVNSNLGWVGGDDGSSHGILKNTTNGGASWNTMTIPSTKTINSVLFFNSTMGWISGIRSSDNYMSIWKTLDGGISWQELTPNSVYGGDKIQFIDENNGWTGNVWGISTTNNGGSLWTYQPTRVVFTYTDFDAIDTNKAWSVGKNGKIIYTTTGGVYTNLAPTVSKPSDVKLSSTLKNVSTSFTVEDVDDVDGYYYVYLNDVFYRYGIWKAGELVTFTFNRKYYEYKEGTYNVDFIIEDTGGNRTSTDCILTVKEFEVAPEEDSINGYPILGLFFMLPIAILTIYFNKKKNISK